MTPHHDATNALPDPRAGDVLEHAATAPGRSARPTWVPIRSLAPTHRPRILAHLLQLDAHDRYLRFGYPASDEQIERYVAGLDFERDELIGVFDRRLQLIAWAHLAFAPESSADAPATAEFGVSVLARARGRRLGGRLFERAMLLARNRGVDTLLIHALSENAAMLHLARAAGAIVERHGAETEARLKLPPETLASQVEELMSSRAAEVDYGIKTHHRRVDDWYNALQGSLAGEPPR